MKEKLLKTMRALCVVALLGVGVNASWADPVTLTFDFAAALSGNDISWTREESGLTTTLISNDSGKLYLPRNCSYDFMERFLFTRAYQGSGASNDFYLRNKSAGLFVQSPKNGACIAIRNLVVGDIISIKTSSEFKFKGTSHLEGVASDTETAIVSEQEYTVNSAGDQLIYIKNSSNDVISKIIIKTSSDDVRMPSAAVSSVNTSTGVRTVAITNGVSTTGQTVTTYYGTTTALNSSNYSSAGTAVVGSTIDVAEDVTNLYLISISSSGKSSQPVTYDVAKATKLASASIQWKEYGTLNDNYLLGAKFTIKQPDNSSVIGTPATQTLEYTFTPDGGEESSRTATTNNAVYTPTGNGTLTIYANTKGYVESSYSIPVSNYYTPNGYETDYTTYDSGPFGDNNKDVSTDWWTGATAWRSKAKDSSAATLGRIRFSNNSVTDLVIGYGLGRAHATNSLNLKVRYATKGNIEVMTINNTNSSGENAGTYYSTVLETGGAGDEGDLSAEFSVTHHNTLKIHRVYSPAELPSSTVSGTITSTGWSTFASSYPLDLSTISGGTAYYASAASGSTVTLTSTTQTVQAGEGIMVKGTAGETFTIGVAASGTAISGNLLKGQTTTGDVAASTDGTYHYVFGFESASKYGFYNLTAATSVAAGKAYLETTSALTSGGSRLSIVFDDEVTGINDVKANMSDGRGEYFNLQGQRVDNPKKGLYIVNGMKINMK